jgi:hypothetical protein
MERKKQNCIFKTVIYVENLIGCTKKLLQLITEFGKIISYKGKYTKWICSLYISKKQSKV